MFHWRAEILPGVSAAFTDSGAGNLALHVGDDAGAVQRRREQLEAAAGIEPRSLRFMNQVHVQPVHAGVGAAGLSNWGQQRPTAVPADSGFDVDLPSVVEPDLTGSRSDDLDVPDFLK